MSIDGETRLRLEMRRLEELRIRNVRSACSQLCNAFEQALAAVDDIAVQQLARAELTAASALGEQGRSQFARNPDTAQATLTEALAQVHLAVVSAEAGAQRWRAEQAAAIGNARAIAAEAAATTLGHTPAEALARDAQASAEQAVQLATQGQTAEAEQARSRASSLLTQARASEQDETVRRELVVALMQSLRNMGFGVVRPQLRDGLVVLEGRLASGRRARFDIALDGALGFALDGYEGRACAKDLERIKTELRDHYGIRMGPPQFVWTQPARIGDDALPLPNYQGDN